MNIEQFDLPTHWASPLINGDESGLEDSDITSLNKFTDWMIAEYGQCWCVDCFGGDNFRTYHDARRFGVLACDVSTYSFDIG